MKEISKDKDCRNCIFSDIIGKNSDSSTRYWCSSVGGRNVSTGEYAKECEKFLPLNKGNANSRKDDVKDNKPMWQLFPFAELSGVVDVYTAGAKKYGENRWQKLEDGENRYFAAMCRHWVEHLRGNEIDPEDGCLHIDKCIWNLIAVRHCFLEGKGIDPNTTNYSSLKHNEDGREQ